MSTVWTIIKKELKRFFTDRRTLFAIFFPGILLFLIYSVMGNFLSEKIIESTTVTEVKMCIKNQPTELDPEGAAKSFFNEIEIQHFDDLSKDEAIEKIKNKELDLYVVYEENFMTKVNAYDISSNTKAPDVEIYFNGANDASSSILNTYTTMLSTFEQSLNNKFDINAGGETYNLATNEEQSAQMLVLIVPFLLTIMLFSSSMGLCAESVAGEKERGTIATLLATPTKRWQIALGKVIPLGIVSLCAGVVSSLGAIFSIPNLMQGTGVNISLSAYGFGGFALLLLMVILTSVFFASLLCVFSTFAKTVKESSSLCLIPMILVFCIGMIGMFLTTASTDWWVYLIPVFNSMQCFTQIFSLAINPLCIVITILSNLAFIALFVFIVGKMFNNEKIMFSK